MSVRGLLRVAAATLLIGTTSANAAVEIQWWHAMTGGNNDVVVRLANDFNAAQQEYKVVPTYKGSYPDTMNAGIAAFRAGNAPHIMQVFFPFNSSSTVMWINKDAFRKAGLNPDVPPKTWPEVFDAAKKLKAAGYATCGFSNAWVTWVNTEQLSAWHNVPLATKANGLDGFDTVLNFNGPLHVKHLQNLVELQKDKTYDYSGRTNTGEGRFTSGECPIFLTSSAFFGNVRGNAKFDFGNAPMPYYPDVPGAPQNSIIGGASLWVMGGKKPEEYKGVARFLAFLSETDRQVAIHKASGYLPITKAAYAKTKESGYYKEAPYLETPLLELTNKEPTENSRGLRLGNMVQLRDVWAEEYEAALSGKKSAKEALDAAVARGNQMLRQFERTISR